MNNVLALQKPSFSLTPSSLAEAMEFAGMMSKSSIVPKDYQNNPGNILVAIQWGMEIGLQPLQSMQSIAVINGRPSIWGDAMLALVRSSGLLEAINEEVTDSKAVCTIKRRGEQEVVREFSMQAGLSPYLEPIPLVEAPSSGARAGLGSPGADGHPLVRSGL